jgi:hypothetical protein
MICLDDNIEDHPKFVSLTDEAFGLWIRCIAYCRRNLTDGYIPKAAAVARVRRKRAAIKVIAELLAAPIGAPGKEPLWTEVEGGYRVHDYFSWNPSREKVDAEREVKRAAGRAGGRRSGEARGKQLGSKARENSNQDLKQNEADCFDVASRSGSALANPDPIRSDPDPEEIFSSNSLPQYPTEKARARPAAAAGPDGPTGQSLRAELRRHAATQHLDEASVRLLEMRAAEMGIPAAAIPEAIEWSVNELEIQAAATGGGTALNTEATLRKLVSGLRGSRTRAQSPTQRSRDRPSDIRPHVDPTYEAREAEANAELMAELRRKRAADEARGEDVTF